MLCLYLLGQNCLHLTFKPYLKMLGLYLLGQYCLHLTFWPYLRSETYSRKYEKLSNIVIHACKNNTEKCICWKCLARNLALFIYVSTHCVGKVKWLDFNRYSQLTRWCSGNASALGARCPGFNPQLRQEFLCLIFCFFCCCVFTFLSKTHYLSQKFAIPFFNFNLFSILKILQDLWPIIRV